MEALAALRKATSKQKQANVDHLVSLMNNLQQKANDPASPKPPIPDLTHSVKTLLRETNVRATIIGNKGTGKSFLVNSLLEATAPSEKEYGDMSPTPHLSSMSTSYNFETPPSKYIAKTSYSFSEDTPPLPPSSGKSERYGTSTLYSFNGEDSKPNVQPYERATTYSFEASTPETGFEWEIGNVSETFIPDGNYHKTVNWELERKAKQFSGDDSHPFLLPQGLQGDSKHHGPMCFDLRYGTIPELVVSFVDVGTLRQELWQVHQVEMGKKKYESQSHRTLLENRYRFVLGLPPGSKIPIGTFQSLNDFTFRPEMERLFGKTFRFRGIGKSFTLDRVYIREKLREILTNFGHYVTNILLKMPCKILEGNIELAELSGIETPVPKLSRFIQNANLLIVALDGDGISKELASTLCRDDCRHSKKVFLDMVEVREGPTLPSQLLKKETVERASRFKSLVTQQALQILPQSIEEAARDPWIISLRPRLYSLLKSRALAPQHLEGRTLHEVVRATALPSLLNWMANSKLTQCAEPFRQANQSWLEAKFSRHVTNTLVSGISELSLGLQEKTTKVFDFLSSSPTTCALLGKEERPRDSALFLTELANSFQEFFLRWRKELVHQVTSIEQVLLPTAKACYSKAQSEWQTFKDQFLPTHEACRGLLHPAFRSNELGTSINRLTCGELLQRAPQFWKENIAQVVPDKIQQMLKHSSRILEECLVMLQSSPDASSQDTERLEKLVSFCQGSHERTVKQFNQFQRHVDQDISPLVEAACADAVQSQLLETSQDIESSGPQDLHEAISHALPEIPFIATKNIQKKFSEKLEGDLRHLDRAEKDLERAIRSVLIVVRSAPKTPNAPNRALASKGPKSSASEDVMDVAREIEKYQNIHMEDQRVIKGHQSSHNSQGPWALGFALFDDAKPFHFPKVLPTDSSQRLRYEEQLRQANLHPVPVTCDSHSQFRAFAKLVYGCEEAHSLVRLLLMAEMLTNPTIYASHVPRLATLPLSPSDEMSAVQDFVSGMARESQTAESLTLRAFANFYGVDVLMYSPQFTHPLLIASQHPHRGRVMCLAFVEQYYAALMTPEGQQEWDSQDSLDEFEVTCTPPPSPSHDWFEVSGVVNESNASEFNPPDNPEEKQSRKYSQPLRMFSPVSLADMCVAKVSQYAEYLPDLEGCLPEEVAQEILSQMIREKRLNNESLAKLIGSSLYYLQLDGASLNDSACDVIAQKCPNLIRLSLSGNPQISNEGIAALAKGCPNLESLDLSGCIRVGTPSLVHLAMQCSKLQTLHLSGPKISDPGVLQLSQGCQSLTRLSLRECGKLSDDAFGLLPSSLTTLDLTGCDRLTDTALGHIATRCHHMTTLQVSSRSITDKGLLLLAQNCPQLRELDLRGCDHVTDVTLRSLSRFCLDLTTLRLSCRSLTGEAFGNAFPNLIELDLSRCLNLTDEAVDLISRQSPLLENLTLTSCEDLTDLSLQSLARRCGSLRALNLSKCVSLTDEGVAHLLQHCSQISQLCLYNCRIGEKTLSTLSKHCPLLQQLDLSSCEGITDASLRELSQGCPNLQVLSLEECPATAEGIISLADHSVHLQTLKLAYCKGVTDESLQALAKGCRGLRHVDLSYCSQLSHETLQDAVMQWPHLESLQLRGFPFTSELLSHPSLRSLTLSWCKQLEDSALEHLAIGCPNLSYLDIAWAGKVTASAVHRLAQELRNLQFLNLRGCAKVTFLTIKFLSNASLVIYT